MSSQKTQDVQERSLSEKIEKKVNAISGEVSYDIKEKYIKEFIKRLKDGHCNNPKCLCCEMKNRHIINLAGEKLI